MTKDRLIHGAIANEQFRLFAVESTELVQKTRDLHDLYPLPAIMMGRLMTAAALMSGELKSPGSEVSIRIDADGELKGALVIASQEGNLRGYAYAPDFWAENPEDNFLVGKHLGKGLFTVIKQRNSQITYQGSVELISGEIGSDLAEYYNQSEQTPTAVNLGVLIDRDAKVRAAGGVLIQQLPSADPEIADRINSNMASTPNISDLMDMGLKMEEILEKFILKGLDWRIYSESELNYRCTCSKERFADALALLGREELESMSEGIAPVCHYCNSTYEFSASDIADILARPGLS